MNTPPPKPLFSNPYSDFSEEKGNSKRLVGDISVEDFMFLRNMRIGRDTIQTTINLLIYKLVNELKRHGITGYAQSDEFELAVAGCRLVLPTASDTNGKAASCDDGGGVAAASAALQDTPQLPANPPRRAAKRSRVGHKRTKTAGGEAK